MDQVPIMKKDAALQDNTSSKILHLLSSIIQFNSCPETCRSHLIRRRYSCFPCNMCTSCVPSIYRFYANRYRWGPYNYPPVMSSLFCPNPSPSWSFYGAGCPLSTTNTGYCPCCGYYGIMYNPVSQSYNPVSQSYNSIPQQYNLVSQPYNTVADFPINTMYNHVFNQFNKFNPERFVKLPCLEQMFNEMQKTPLKTPLLKQAERMATVASKLKCDVRRPLAKPARAAAVYRPRPEMNEPGTSAFRLVTEGPRVLNPRLTKSRAPSKSRGFPTTDGRTIDTPNSNKAY